MDQKKRFEWRYREDVAYVIVKCPRTGMNVQTPIRRSIIGEDASFESFECLACRQLHYINKATGEVMGDLKA